MQRSYKQTAQEALENLKYERDIESACLYNDEGELFAKYISEERDEEDEIEEDTGSVERHCPENIERRFLDEQHHIEHMGDEDWLISQRITDESDVHIGYIVIVSDSRIMREFLKEQLFAELIIIIIVMIISIFLSLRLQNYIIEPIEKLSKTASTISRKRDYSIRAKKYGDDEIGKLTDAINNMLDIIEDSTRELKSSKEKAEEANNAKTEFLSNMSHELRTPMHAILRFSQNGSEDIENTTKEELKEYFDDINISGKRLTKLIDNLLDISKYSSGKLSVDFNEGSLIDVVKHSIKELKVLIDEKNLDLKFDYDDSLPNIRFDYNLMVQVIVNLLSNAIKFTPEGKKINISLKKNSTQLLNDTDSINVMVVKFSMSDEGIGIPEGELESIFDYFVQSSKTKTGAGGTGLGLAICKQILDIHYGRIWAENNKNGGSTFNFIIPL